MTVSENSPLHEHSALDLKTEPDEERRHRIEVRDGDADMVEASCVRHRVILQLLVLSIHSRDEADGRSRHRSRGFQHASHPRRSASSVPPVPTLPARVSRPQGVMQLAPRHRRSEPPSPRAPADRHAAPVGWLLVHRIRAVVVEAKGLPEGEPTAVRYNSSGLSGREPHSSPKFRQGPSCGLGRTARRWRRGWLPGCPWPRMH